MPIGYDRTARLIRVWHLLYQNPHGLKLSDIAARCDVSSRTTRRDLDALQMELRLPITQIDGRYVILRNGILPPLLLTIPEAMALFISSRLASKYSDERDPRLESVFVQLASILPAPVADHVLATVAEMVEKPDNQVFTKVSAVLAGAWAERKSVRILYASGGSDPDAPACERVIEPYFIEPSGVSRACYVIGFDHQSQQVRTFKVERISSIVLTGDSFELPSGWSAREFLRNSWGIMEDAEVEVKIRFSRAVARRVKETFWHESQLVTEEPDGSLLFIVRVAGTVEITPWILSWGAEAEVLQPASLRAQLVETFRRQAVLYGQVVPAETS